MTVTCTFCEKDFGHFDMSCPHCGAFDGLSVIDEETGKKRKINSHGEYLEIQNRITKQKQSKNKLRFISGNND